MNPVHRMSHNLIRPLMIHGASKHDAPAMAEAALRRVSLEPPSRFLESYPHELSGGQLQRISMRAHCAFNPRCCSPTSRSRCWMSRCVSAYSTCCAVCARTTDSPSSTSRTILLGALHRGLDHRDVRRASRRAVSGTTLVDEPTHPYTQLLIASVPDPSDTAKEHRDR